MVKGENRLNRVSDITNRTENFNITAGGSLASWQFTKGKVVKFGSIGPQNASDWSLLRTAFCWVQGPLKFKAVFYCNVHCDLSVLFFYGR